MSEDFYDVLGVDRDASEDEINRAFRKKAAEYHPDVSDDPDAEEKFKQAKKAKEVLTDEEKRQAYDRLGHERFEQAEKRGGFDGQGGAGGRGGGQGPFGGMGGMGGGMGDINDIFENLFGGGAGGGRQQGPRAGRDMEGRISIDLEEAYEGTRKEVTMRRPENCEDCGGTGHPDDAESRTCPQCDGQGQVTQVQQTPFGRMQQTRACDRCGGDGEVYSETCSTCGGEGRVTRQAAVDVDIPAGIRDGQTVRVQGEGEPGEPGAPDGDLLIEVSVADHEEFDRDGDDLYTRQAVSFPQAVFGDTVEVSTLDGDVEFDVPTGTQSGETFRLQGKGMPRQRGRGNGDLYVQVRVVTPQDLNEEQREALEAFAEAGGEEIDVEQGFFERIRNSI